MQIVLVIFCILTVAGAWAAWRRSPLYSLRVTLKLAGALLLIVGAIVGITLAVLGGPVRLSQTMQAVLLSAGTIAIATGATALIVRISDAHVAQLPPSARIVTTERHKVQRWIWRIAVYLTIGAAAALILPSSWIWLPLALGGFVLLLCGPTLMALYLRARRLDLGLSSVMASPWARWEYTPEQWRAWAGNQLEWERSKEVRIAWRREWRKILKGGALMASIFLGAAWVMVSGSVGEKLAEAGIGMAFVLVLAGCLNWATRGACERRYRRLLAAPAQALFGDEGLFCNGEFAPWILSGSYLVEAAALHDPPARLSLVFQTFNGSSSARVEKRIPIPQGRESDVPLLQQKLRAKCPKAAIRLT